MVACKILLACLAVVVLNARESLQSQLLKNSLMGDCACFPTDKGSVRISKLADKHGKHERTVIYLYRHQDTRDVTVYVPNEEKQTKFPDLTVNSLEFYGLHTLDNLYQLLNKPSNILTKLPVVEQSHSIDTQYIDIHIPDRSNNHVVNNVLHTHHPHIIDINGKKTSDVVDIEVDLNVKGNEKKETGAGKVELDLQKHTQPIHVVDSVKIVPGHNKVVSNYVNLPTEHVVDNINLISTYDIHNGNVHNLHDHDHDLHDLHGDLHVEWEQNKKVQDLYDKTANHKGGSSDNLNIIISQDTDTPSNLNQNTKYINKENIVLTKPTEGTFTVLDDVILDTGFNYINKIQELLNGNKNKAIPSSVNLKPLNNPVFEKWLFEEFSNVGTDGSGTLSYDTVDLQEIKIHLLLVLEQNGLHFSESGDLVDNNGHLLKISNLKLRRVMISDPVVYNKLGGRNCVPHGIHYLEAVFVSLAYPPTVLGVIPLKMTSLPSCKGGKCPGKVCTSRSDHRIIVNSKHPNKMNLAPTHNTKLGLMPRHGLGDQNPDLLQLREHNIRVNDGHDRNDLVNPPPGHDNDDGLGIRIIGGGAATSSGTPVHSRGRSGKAVRLTSH